jgi:hypothetical protein
MLNTGGKCVAIVLFLFLAVSTVSVCAEGVPRFCLRSAILPVGVWCISTLDSFSDQSIHVTGFSGQEGPGLSVPPSTT